MSLSSINSIKCLVLLFFSWRFLQCSFRWGPISKGFGRWFLGLGPAPGPVDSLKFHSQKMPALQLHWNSGWSNPPLTQKKIQSNIFFLGPITSHKLVYGWKVTTFPTRPIFFIPAKLWWILCGEIVVEAWVLTPPFVASWSSVWCPTRTRSLDRWIWSVGEAYGSIYKGIPFFLGGKITWKHFRKRWSCQHESLTIQTQKPEEKSQRERV